MSAALMAALVWLVVANVTGMLPSRDYHWRAAYALIAVGLPILIWVAISDGPLWFAAVLIAAGSVLRYPVLYFWRWVRGLAKH